MSIKVQRPGVGAALQKFFRFTGAYQPVLAEDIIPVVQVGDASGAVEPQIIRRATAIISIGGTVGELMTGRFESIGSTICVLRRLFLQTANATTNLRWGFRGNSATLGPLAATPAKSFTDGRVLPGGIAGVSEFPSGVLTIGTQVASLGLQHGQIRLAAEGTLLDLGGWVVGTGVPGIVGFWEFQISSANSLTLGFLEWDEHPVV